LDGKIKKNRKKEIVKKKKYRTPVAAIAGIETESLMAASVRVSIDGSLKYEDYDEVVSEIPGDLIIN
jgi:predicted metal-dependent peptidase